MSQKAWKLSHKKDGNLIKYSLSMFGETRQLTVDLNAPPIPYVFMHQWFLDLFQKIWWTERDGRNFLFYNQVIEDFIKVIVKYRNDKDAVYPFE